VIYYQFAPDFAEKYAAYVIDQARKSGATDAQNRRACAGDGGVPGHVPQSAGETSR
jgi:hypothetical protein